MKASPTITSILKAEVRYYEDTGQSVARVEWQDSNAHFGSTEGSPWNQHIRALFTRARREGAEVIDPGNETLIVPRNANV